MNRLTGHNDEYCDSDFMELGIAKYFNRLVGYENTELEPQEVIALKERCAVLERALRNVCVMWFSETDRKLDIDTMTNLYIKQAEAQAAIKGA